MTPPESLSHRDGGTPADADAGSRSALRVVLAPNAFKGTLTASDAARAMARGVHDAVPDARVDLVPIADGGDGSVDAFVAAGFARHHVETRGPTGEPVASSYASDCERVIVELADACGMARLPGGRLAPMDSSTLGLGDAIREALDRAPQEVVVCLGGSASTDGGAGVLVALGARLLDAHGAEVAPCGAALGRVVGIDVFGLDPRLASVRLVVAVDVDAPLTGECGAAEVFAPQKGASPAQVVLLDAALGHWAVLLEEAFGRAVPDIPGAGAAGGTAAALLALGAAVRPGFDVVSQLVQLPGRIGDADLVITGEGRLDEQTARGKGVGGVAALARAAGIPTLAVCGDVAMSPEQMRDLGVTAAIGLRTLAASDDEARSNAAEFVAQATVRAVRAWSSD